MLRRPRSINAGDDAIVLRHYSSLLLVNDEAPTIAVQQRLLLGIFITLVSTISLSASRFTAAAAATDDEAADEKNLPSSLIRGGDEAAAAACRSSDYRYEYTACDASSGQRWRYAIPKASAKQKCARMPPPLKRSNCRNYLDMESERCRRCPPGTYSLGDGARYEQFERMPAGFTVENYPDESEQLLLMMRSRPQKESSSPAVDERQSKEEECPSRAGWVVQSQELRYIPTPCVSKLSISLNLVRDGYIEFYYKMPKNERSLIALLQVRNAQCQNYGGDDDPRGMLFFQSQSMATTSSAEASRLSSDSHRKSNQQRPSDGVTESRDDGEFRVRRVQVRAGQNLVEWTVANNRDLTTLADIIHVPKIDVFGLAFTPACTACPSGTFSSEWGARKCRACPANAYSRRGAARCEACVADDEYSEPRAERCTQRPTCEPQDYRQQWGDCRRNGTRVVSQRRVRPLICRESNSQSSAARVEKCGECSAGMFRDSADGECKYCPLAGDYYSPSGRECLKCPSGSTPEYGLYFTRWEDVGRRPELITTCEYLDDERPCDLGDDNDDAQNNDDGASGAAWLSRGDRMESAPTRARGVALELAVEVAHGFYNPLRMGGGGDDGVDDGAKPASVENPLARVSVEVETRCADASCQLYFVVEPLARDEKRRRSNASGGGAADAGAFELIAALNGTQPRRRLIHAVLRAQPARFVLAFMRSGAALERDSLADVAILYSFNVTNPAAAAAAVISNAQTRAAAAKHYGGAAKCVVCPARASNGECRACPMGHYLSANRTDENNTDSSTNNSGSSSNGRCVRCPSGSVLNMSSSMVGVESCVRCGAHLVANEDGSECVFSGVFQLSAAESPPPTINDELTTRTHRTAPTGDDTRTMRFDMSALKNIALTANGIRVYAHEANSYYHSFNVSLFGDRPVQCQDTVDYFSISTSFLSPNGKRPPTAAEIAAAAATRRDEDALFCRSTALPSVTTSAAAAAAVSASGATDDDTGSSSSASLVKRNRVLYVSTTVVSRKLAAVTQERVFRQFRLSDEQLEYDSTTPLATTTGAHRPLDIHFYYEPTPATSARMSAVCPHGTLGVVTTRCAPMRTADNPLVRLSRQCPDGTCDGCLYHVIVESVLACPLCRPEDFREIRGECLDGRRRIHLIPAEHCVRAGISGERERVEACSTLSASAKLVLLFAAFLIACLLLVIALIYQRTRTLQYRYSRLIDGKEALVGANSCALESDNDDDEEEDDVDNDDKAQADTAKTRVFFGRKKPPPPPPPPTDNRRVNGAGNNGYMVSVAKKTTSLTSSSSAAGKKAKKARPRQRRADASASSSRGYTAEEAVEFLSEELSE